jgi:hypothetical protein
VGLSVAAEIFEFSKEDLQYPPLDHSKDSLRLLTLHPGGWPGLIRCELSATTFSENPEYDALSYAWGDSKRTKAIRVNGTKVHIKENLWQALYHLRHPKEQRTLWIDSLCINQADTSEKNKQIPLMAFIFRRAQQVLIWSGNHKPPERVRLRLQRPRDWIDDSTREKKSAAWKKAEPFLWQLIHEEYWKRTWVIQEVGMASKIKVCYGHDSLGWKDFVEWIDRYRRLNPGDVAADSIFTLEAMQKSKFTNATTLESLIEIFKDSFCTLPHDKIYAFLGLANDHFDSRIPVDYGKSLYEVYQDVLRSHCTASALEREERSIELVHYSALVRRLLTREGIQRPKRERAAMDEFEEGVRPQIKRKSVQAEKKRPAAEETSPRADPNRASTSTYTSYSVGYSTTRFTGKAKQKSPEAEQESEESEEESRKTKKPDYRYVLLAGTILLLGVWAVYYTVSGSDPPKEWHWKASGPEDIATWTRSEKSPQVLDEVALRGAIVGQIKHIGPSTFSLVASHDATRRWIASLPHHFTTFKDLNKARGLNEKLLKILDDPEDLQTRNVTSLQPSVLGQESPSQEPGDQLAPSQNSPRLFLGSSVILGLIPPNAREGDIICQFWNSNACAVLRRREYDGSFSRFWEAMEPRYELVGRAAIVSSGIDADWDVPMDKEAFGESSSAVKLVVSLTDLTRLSLDTVNLPATEEIAS